MNNYVYSPTKNTFFLTSGKLAYQSAGIWPDDALDVDDSVFLEFTGKAPDGQQRVAGENGPEWADIPAPTEEELIAQAEAVRADLRAKADSEIEWRQDAVDAGIATEEEDTDLAAWKKYRVLLMRVDTSKAPAVEWPTPPGK